MNKSEHKLENPDFMKPDEGDLQVGQVWLAQVEATYVDGVSVSGPMLCEITRATAGNLMILVRPYSPHLTLPATWTTPKKFINSMLGYYGRRRRWLFGLISYVRKEEEWYGEGD